MARRRQARSFPLSTLLVAATFVVPPVFSSALTIEEALQTRQIPITIIPEPVIVTYTTENDTIYALKQDAYVLTIPYTWGYCGHDKVIVYPLLNQIQIAIFDATTTASCTISASLWSRDQQEYSELLALTDTSFFNYINTCSAWDDNTAKLYDLYVCVVPELWNPNGNWPRWPDEYRIEQPINWYVFKDADGDGSYELFEVLGGPTAVARVTRISDCGDYSTNLELSGWSPDMVAYCGGQPTQTPPGGEDGGNSEGNSGDDGTPPGDSFPPNPTGGGGGGAGGTNGDATTPPPNPGNLPPNGTVGPLKDLLPQIPGLPTLPGLPLPPLTTQPGGQDASRDPYYNQELPAPHPNRPDDPDNSRRGYYVMVRRSAWNKLCADAERFGGKLKDFRDSFEVVATGPHDGYTAVYDRVLQSVDNDGYNVERRPIVHWPAVPAGAVLLKQNYDVVQQWPCRQVIKADDASHDVGDTDNGLSAFFGSLVDEPAYFSEQPERATDVLKRTEKPEQFKVDDEGNLYIPEGLGQVNGTALQSEFPAVHREASIIVVPYCGELMESTDWQEWLQQEYAATVRAAQDYATSSVSEITRDVNAMKQDPNSLPTLAGTKMREVIETWKQGGLQWSIQLNLGITQITLDSVDIETWLIRAKPAISSVFTVLWILIGLQNIRNRLREISNAGS